MSTLLPVFALAAAWHVGLALLERRLRRERGAPSLARLLVSAEVELLRTLHAELRRRTQAGHERGCRRKLEEVEERLRELDGDGTGRDA